MDEMTKHAIQRDLIEAWKLAGQMDQCRAAISRVQALLDSEPPQADASAVDYATALAAEFDRKGWEIPHSVLTMVVADRHATLERAVERAVKWLNINKGWMGWRENDIEVPSFKAAILGE